MSKRSTPLSNYDWDYLDQAPPAKRRAIEAADDDDEEEETVAIDEDTPQQQGLAVLNTMPVKGNKIKVADEEIPSVPLRQHYTTLYNSIMTTRFPPSESNSSSDEEEEDDDLFASLARSDSSSVSASQRMVTEAIENVNKAASSFVTRAKKSARIHYKTEERGECFLCAYGNRFHDGVSAKHINRLFDIMDTYGMCDNVELAQKLHLFFKVNVYKAETGMSMLTKEIALEHIEAMHTLSATIFIGESIKTWREVFFSCANELFRANGTIDKAKAMLMKDAQKMLNELYKMDPSKMVFNFGKSREDTNKQGAPFRMMPEFKQKKEKDKRAKKTSQLSNANQVYNRGLEI